MSVGVQIDRLNNAKSGIQIQTGDMQKSTYDPRGMNQDIFKYCDNKVSTIDGGSY